MKTTEIVDSLVRGKIAEMGYELDEVEYVSSIGIDRPLKKDRDFERNMGKKLQVKLYAPINKKKELLGILTGYDGESFTISVEKTGEVTIKRKDAALIRPWIDFE